LPCTFDGWVLVLEFYLQSFSFVHLRIDNEAQPKLNKRKSTHSEGERERDKKEEEEDRSMCNQEKTPKSTNKGSKRAT
jgi:hypothetical protein